MKPHHQASTCALALPTIFAERPVWLEAGDCAWSCCRTSQPQPLASTEGCAACPYWQPLDACRSGEESWADDVRVPLLIDVLTRPL